MLLRLSVREGVVALTSPVKMKYFSSLFHIFVYKYSDTVLGINWEDII